MAPQPKLKGQTLSFRGPFFTSEEPPRQMLQDFRFLLRSYRPLSLSSPSTISQLWFVLSDGGNCRARRLVLLAGAAEDAYTASDVALDKDGSAHEAIREALLSSISLRRSHLGTEAASLICDFHGRFVLRQNCCKRQQESQPTSGKWWCSKR